MGWYYCITEEMRALGLKGNELIVFAIVNGHSQNGEGCYFGSLSHLCEVAGITRPTAIDTLKKLVEYGYIVKEDTYNRGVKYCSYRVVKNLYTQLKNFTEGSKEILLGGSKEILPNNKCSDNKDAYIKEERKNTIKKKYGSSVYLTDEEYGKLTAIEDEAFASACIEKLDLYKTASGKTYKSDYAAILNWVVGRVREDQARTSAPVRSSEKESWVESNARLIAEAKANLANSFSSFPSPAPERELTERQRIENMLERNGYYDLHPEAKRTTSR